MLTAEDKEKLKQLAKECKEARVPVQILIGDLLNRNPSFFSTVHMVCIDDDGRIDPEEAKLLTWSRDFLFRVEHEDIHEIIPLLLGR